MAGGTYTIGALLLVVAAILEKKYEKKNNKDLNGVVNEAANI